MYKANRQVGEAIRLLKLTGVIVYTDNMYKANRQVEEVLRLLEHVVKIEEENLAEDYLS